ncbi:hypothetical protein JCM8547_005162 [Rhodosporidiobolus lusitaniae]
MGDSIGSGVETRPTLQDNNNGTAEIAWIRPGRWTYTIEILDIQRNRLARRSDKNMTPVEFTSAASRRGWSEALSITRFEEDGNSTHDTLIDYADVAFDFSSDSTSSPYYVFATKLVLKKQCPHLATRGIDNFGVFELGGTSSPFPEPCAASPEPEPPTKKRKISQPPSSPSSPLQRPTAEQTIGSGDSQGGFDEAVGLEAEAGAEDGKEGDPAGGEQRSADQAAGSGEQPREGRLRRVQIVAVKDFGCPSSSLLLRIFFPLEVGKHLSASYATYVAFIEYLHTDVPPFSNLPSNYLAGRAAGKIKEARKDWLGKKTFHKFPATPHSLYRLADQYLMNDLRELCKGYIVRSLTIENPFCELSMHYDDFQQPIVKFLTENWCISEKVQETAAMKHLLELLEAGQLPRGASFLCKIFSGLAA